ncbi:MAG: TM2 domain-containing protein [Aliidongia sp.]
MNKLLYLQTLKTIRDSLPEGKRSDFDLQFGGREKNPVVALVLSLFLGGFGVDRFYIGSVGLGLLKLFTLGLLGLFTIVDWFLITGAARQANVVLASEIKVMLA